MLYMNEPAITSDISGAEADRAFGVIVRTIGEEMVADHGVTAIRVAKGQELARLAPAAIDTIAVSSPSENWKGPMIPAGE